MIKSVSGMPETYDELWVHYRVFVIKQVRSMGIPESDVEDVASEILVRFMENKMLEKFDPDRLWDIQQIAGRPSKALLPGPRMRPAKFGSFLRRFVYLYSLQWRDRLARRRQREGLPLEVLGADRTDRNDHEGQDALEQQGAELAAACLAAGVLEHPKYDLVKALEVCAESVGRCGRVDRGFLAAQMGVSKSQSPKIIAALREVLIEAGAEEALRNVA